MNWHLISAEETSRVLDTGSKGLFLTNVRRKIEEYGKNEVEEAKRKDSAHDTWLSNPWISWSLC
ncbi:MAG: hypothetical protein IPG99_17140 [Ignavibacteria bacterium]|nr:hypothetical protein [Ignavibacteria bacterium]